jgi:hypothetical protein
MGAGQRWLAGLALALAASGYACSKSRPSQPRADGSTGGAADETRGGTGAGLAGVTSAAGARDGGGAAGDTGSEPPAGTDLLGNAADWETVTTLPGCSTRVAREPAKTWPALSFSSCGAGCRSANVAPVGKPSLGALLGTSARVVDGQLRLTVSARVASTPTTFVLATYDYSGPASDGVPIAVLAETGACFAQVAGRASPNLYKLFPLNGDEVFRMAWLGEAATPQLTWLPRAPTSSLQFFDTGARWGGIEALSDVHVASSATSLTLSSVYQSSGTLRTPAGSQGAAFWSEWKADSGQGQILSWDPDAGVVALAKGEWIPARLGASPTRIAWIGAIGARAFEGSYESAQLYGCGRSSPLRACASEALVTLPISSSSGVLSVSDRWSALTGCSGNTCDVLLADHSNGSLYRLKPRAGHGIEVLGVSETELFAADFGADTRGTPDFDAILRFDLSHLESFATKL